MEGLTVSNIGWNVSGDQGQFDDALTSTSLAPVSEDYQWKYALAGRIRSAFAFITIFVGVIGNSISFRVMTKKVMRVTSTGVFFAAIAISDTATLLTGQVSALLYHMGNFDVVNVHYWSCRWFFVLLFSFADTAVWLMLAVTVDRFISVVFPLKRKDLCTPKRSLITCLCLPCVALVKNMHMFWTRGRQELLDSNGINIDTVECGFPRSDYAHFETYIRPWLAFTLYAFIPLTGLVVLNISIAVALWQHSKKPKSHTKTQGEDGNQQPEAGSGSSSSRASRQAIQLTIMLLTVSIVFTVLISPSIIVLIAKPYLATTPAGLASYSLVEAVVDTLSYVNHSTNFFFYCLSGAGFRKEVQKMFGCAMNRVDALGTEVQSAPVQSTGTT